jgi:hypothetical protein
MTRLLVFGRTTYGRPWYLNAVSLSTLWRRVYPIKDMLERLVKESGIATPTQAELVAFDRKRKNKKLSNCKSRKI